MNIKVFISSLEFLLTIVIISRWTSDAMILKTIWNKILLLYYTSHLKCILFFWLEENVSWFKTHQVS